MADNQTGEFCCLHDGYVTQGRNANHFSFNISLKTTPKSSASKSEGAAPEDDADGITKPKLDAVRCTLTAEKVTETYDGAALDLISGAAPARWHRRSGMRR